MATYRLSPGADTAGITEMGVVELPPLSLVHRFGPPAEGDGFKTSGEYVFQDDGGEVFVVHDWKSTSLWDPEYPPPDEFWSLVEPVELSVSTRDIPTGEFEVWLAAATGQT